MTKRSAAVILGVLIVVPAPGAAQVRQDQIQGPSMHLPRFSRDHVGEWAEAPRGSGKPLIPAQATSPGSPRPKALQSTSKDWAMIAIGMGLTISGAVLAAKAKDTRVEQTLTTFVSEEKTSWPRLGVAIGLVGCGVTVAIIGVRR